MVLDPKGVATGNASNSRLPHTEYQPLEGQQPPVHIGAERTGFQAVITSPWVMRWSAIPATYATYRTIRKNSTVALARELAVTPIIASEWTIKSDEGVPKEWENYVRDVFMPLRDEYLATALYFGDVDFGYQCWEKIIEPADGYLKLTRLKQLLHDITEICIGHKGGFIGVRQVGQNLGLNNSIHCGFRVEGSYLYGIPLLENIRTIYNMWTDCNEGARRYDRKIAGSHIVVEYPPGSSFDRYGKEVENAILANQILQTLESSGGIAVPRDLAAYMALLNTQDPGWKIWIMDSGGGHQHSFTDRLEYLDKQFTRGLHVPERAMMEGSHGTMAEAEAHADVIFTIQDIKHRRVTNELNRQAVRQMLYLNFGKESIKGSHPRVRLIASPIADKQKMLFTQLYTQLLGSPAGQNELQQIDMKSMRDQLGIPTHPADPGQDAFEQQQQGQPQLQGIPGVSQGVPGGPGRQMVALDKDGHPVTVDGNQPPQQLAQAMANAIEGKSTAVALSASTLEKLSLNGENDTEPHQYACVMANLPEPLRSKCLNLASHILNDELDEQGREVEPHVTVLYGLHTNDQQDVKKLVQEFGSVKIKLGPLKIFPANEKQSQRGGSQYDVLYASVKSKDLVTLNNELKSLPHTSTFPKYVPHVCIAYLKPGEGKKYVGRKDLNGQECEVNSVIFSPVEGPKTQIPLSLSNEGEPIELEPEEHVDYSQKWQPVLGGEYRKVVNLGVHPNGKKDELDFSTIPHKISGVHGYSFEFSRTHPKSGYPTTQLTRGGKLASVFTSAVDSLKELLDDKDPDYVKFTALEPKREKAYDALIQQGESAGLGNGFYKFMKDPKRSIVGARYYIVHKDYADHPAFKDMIRYGSEGSNIGTDNKEVSQRLGQAMADACEAGTGLSNENDEQEPCIKHRWDGPKHLILSYHLPGYNQGGQEGFTGWGDNLDDEFAGMDLYASKEQPGYFHVAGIGVDKPFRRQGYATELFNRAHNLVQEAGHKGVISHPENRSKEAEELWSTLPKKKVNDWDLFAPEGTGLSNEPSKCPSCWSLSDKTKDGRCQMCGALTLSNQPVVRRMPSNLSGDRRTLPTQSHNSSQSIPELVGQSLDMANEESTNSSNEHSKEVRRYELPTKEEWTEAQKIVTPQVIIQIELGIEQLNLGRTGPQIIGIPGTYAGDVVGLHVAVVDGDWIKVHNNPDMVEGDNCLHSKGVVPKGWVYVDRNVYKHDRDPIAMHEITETLLEKAGWDYTKSHRAANQFEDNRRKKLGIGMSNEDEQELALTDPLREGEESINGLFDTKFKELRDRLTDPEQIQQVSNKIGQHHEAYIGKSLQNAGIRDRATVSDHTNDIAGKLLSSGLFENFDESRGVPFIGVFNQRLHHLAQNASRGERKYGKRNQQVTSEKSSESPLNTKVDPTTQEGGINTERVRSNQKFDDQTGTEHLDFRHPKEEEFIDELRNHIGSKMGDLGLMMLESKLAGRTFGAVQPENMKDREFKERTRDFKNHIKDFITERRNDPHFVRRIEEKMTRPRTGMGTSNEHDLSLAGTLCDILGDRGLVGAMGHVARQGHKQPTTPQKPAKTQARALAGHFGASRGGRLPVALSGAEDEVELFL